MIPFSGGQQLANGRRTGLGSGFGGVVAYLMHGRREDLDLAAEAADRVAWTSTRNLPVEEPEHAALWMRAWAEQNLRVKKPVYHFGAALAPDEHLSRQQWEHVADRMLEGLGLSEHQAFIALHQDRDHEHIHIAVNRVGPDTRVWKPSFDVFKQQDAARELERELGLRVVPTLRDLRRERQEAQAVQPDRREV
ncbi:MAG: relaxase/mobilization nuclease domain-containing protein, partial [bacterium]|nr:relaxase/mobilization nuclease domain-containing protein [bacterium]